jgi:hypothetical protein
VVFTTWLWLTIKHIISVTCRGARRDWTSGRDVQGEGGLRDRLFLATLDGDIEQIAILFQYHCYGSIIVICRMSGDFRCGMAGAISWEVKTWQPS